MANEPTDKPVQVTGDERRHPAYRLLARAMLALAEVRKPDPAAIPAEPAPDKHPEEEVGNG